MVKISHKKGFTLVEVLVVVSIIGILSGIGVVSFTSAIANARIKDAAYNTTYFLESVATEAKRINDTLLVSVSERKIDVKKNGSNEIFSTFELESINKFVSGSCPEGASTNWMSKEVKFIPKLGLSAAPTEGCLVVQYGDNDLYGSAVKLQGHNSIKPKMKNGSSWSDL